VKCFHCNSTIPQDATATVDYDGSDRACCSLQCAETAQGIIDRGLGDFYRHRVVDSIAHGEQTTNDLNWESFERPAVMKEFVSAENNGMQRAELIVQGVHCGACTWLIERALSGQRGVSSIQVNPATTRGTLIWDPEKVRLSDLLRGIAALGYTPAPFTESATEEISSREYKASVRRLLVAGLGMMQVMSYAVGLYAGALDTKDPQIGEFLRLVSLLVATPVVVYAGAPFFRNAWNNIKARSPGMDVPVALAIGAAYTVSVWNTLAGSGEVYFDSATMFVFFLTGTRFLEMAGRNRAMSLTGALSRHLPKTAMRITGDTTEIVGVMELEAGDRVLVQPGQAFPADGELDDERTHVDEALLTGESDPVVKQRGHAVLAGSINLDSAIHIVVTRVGAETVLAGIGRMVTEAREEKPRLVQIADRIGGWFVAGVLLISTLTAVSWYFIDSARAFEVTLAVLVVTCPCALALATPAAFSVALARLARNGFLLRRPGALQGLTQITDIVFDKTGTLTSGKLRITDTVTFRKFDADKAMALGASLERHSEHPIARAFPLANDQYSVAGLESVKTFVSEGLEGRVGNNLYRIGSPSFVARISDMHSTDFPGPDNECRSVYLADQEGLIARFDIAEHIRDEAPGVISALKKRGLRLTVASGDQATPVKLMARKLGLDTWFPSMKADDKLKLVRKLQRSDSKVAVVGDGINDSPVLAGADVSVAMGGGTSLAQHSADCVLLSNSLLTLIDGFNVADKTMRVVKQNLLWALCYNLTTIPLAATGLLAPWMAALGMSLSSLLVTLNALRLSAVPAPDSAQGNSSGHLSEDATNTPEETNKQCCSNKAA